MQKPSGLEVLGYVPPQRRGRGQRCFRHPSQEDTDIIPVRAGWLEGPPFFYSHCIFVVYGRVVVLAEKGTWVPWGGTEHFSTSSYPVSSSYLSPCSLCLLPLETEWVTYTSLCRKKLSCDKLLKWSAFLPQIHIVKGSSKTSEDCRQFWWASWTKSSFDTSSRHGFWRERRGIGVSLCVESHVHNILQALCSTDKKKKRCLFCLAPDLWNRIFA